MKIINKMREWNILVKLLLFLIFLPLIIFILYFIFKMILTMMIHFGAISIKTANLIIPYLIFVQIIVSLISWIAFTYRLFKAKEVNLKKFSDNRCPKCWALQTKKDIEDGQCWKCDESLV